MFYIKGYVNVFCDRLTVENTSWFLVDLFVLDVQSFLSSPSLISEAVPAGYPSHLKDTCQHLPDGILSSGQSQ